MSYFDNDRRFGGLEKKLQLIAEGQALELTPEEALIYGADYLDEFPEETGNEEEMEDDHEQ